ncbi:MAG: hypothetical protein GVY16_03200 [Planctomycetes bacterium]|jgi:hypothetical protein|nr:hypothetical protein [Phycisphaerae bacterium]NBB94726.1 hypothetical protein [Planctomycetota bacterium]
MSRAICIAAVFGRAVALGGALVLAVAIAWYAIIGGLCKCGLAARTPCREKGRIDSGKSHMAVG